MELGSSGEFVSFGGFGVRMRGGKDEQRLLLSPMFPRLHVNDTDKGGPRAPPRNKMALYEQLTIPAQKFSSGSASAAAPLPLCTPTTSTSSSHVCLIDYCNSSCLTCLSMHQCFTFSVF